MVGLGSWLIDDKDHGKTPVLEFLQVWLGVLDVDDTTKDTKMMNCRCCPIPKFERGLPIDAFARRPIEGVHNSHDLLLPELAWKILGLQHGTRHGDHYLIPAFNDAIFLGRVRGR